MRNTGIYNDIAKRCNGNIYIGVVGPVRTGKSTFIRRFMDVFVLPNMDNEYERQRLMDEMPQSGDGRTITTTEPKFIPAEAAAVSIDTGAGFNVRMVDCVGYLVPGVLGADEEGHERMVKTPWSEDEIPFSAAAEIGTEKVIKEHSVIGIIISSDGSFGNISRESLIEAEEKTVTQLKEIDKPFIIILNSSRPSSNETRKLAEDMSIKYGVPVMPFNCQRMDYSDFEKLFNELLMQFPASEIHFELPGYMDALPAEHWIKATILEHLRSWMDNVETIGNVIAKCSALADEKIVKNVIVKTADMSNGIIRLKASVDETLYYKVVEEIMGAEVENDSQLFILLKEYADAKHAYDGLKDALEQVEKGSYGIVAPELDEMVLDKPKVFKQGNKYGVKMTATAPCLHIIKTDISTEVSPLVGTESQSEDLANYLINQFEGGEQDIWETNLFGKSLKDMVVEQMESKVNHVPDALRGKVQKSLQRISDEGKDYFVCIIF